MCYLDLFLLAASLIWTHYSLKGFFLPDWERFVMCNFTCFSVYNALVSSPTKIQMYSCPFDLQLSVKYFGYVFELDAA